MIKKWMKQLLAIGLSVTMICGSATVTAMATEVQEPEGTELQAEAIAWNEPELRYEDSILLEDDELTDCEEDCYTSSSNPTMEEQLVILAELTDLVRGALLSGETELDISTYGIYTTTAPAIRNLYYSCPYASTSVKTQTGSSSSTGKYMKLWVTSSLSQEEAETWVNQIDAKIAELDAVVKAAGTNLEKVLALHDYMVSHYHYTENIINEDYYPSTMLTKDKGVCQAYAYLMQYVLIKNGVNCYYTSSDTMNHGWNIVELDGQYYHVDATWDDPMHDQYGMVQHTYFLISDDSMQDSVHQHSDWNLADTLTCNDTTYEAAYFSDVTSPVVMDGNYAYYVKGRALCSYNKTNSSETTLKDLGYWPTIGNGGYYLSAYSGLAKKGRVLYYNKGNEVDSYDLDSGVETTIFSNADSSYRVYGCVLTGSTLAYSLQATPSVAYSSQIHNTINIGCTTHNVVVDAAVPATCLETGLTEGSHCSKCETVITAQEVVPALGHDYQISSAAVASGCESEGTTEEKTCARCGDVTGGETVAVLGHNYQVTAAEVAATCTTDGKTAVKTCSRCQDTKGGESIPALGHNYQVSKQAAEASCTQAGNTLEETCTRCNNKKGGAVIAAIGHTEVIDAAVAPTCIESGLTQGSHCSVCREVLVKQSVVAPLGHDNTILVAGIDATCVATGLTEKGYCSRCHEENGGEVIPALGHDYQVTEAAVAATCTTDGKTAAKTCSRCEAVTGGETIAKTGHIYTVSRVFKAATLTADGNTQEKTCTKGDSKIGGTVIPRISTVTLSATKYTYTGTAKTPAVTVKDRTGKVLTNGTHYAVAYTNNTNVGTATATITFKGNYSGSKKLTYTISLATPTTNRANALTGVKVTWTKITGATGYYVYRKEVGAASWTKIKEITSGATVTYTDTTAVSGKNYYYTVKAYRTVNGSKLAGSFKSSAAIKYLKCPAVTLANTTKGVKVSWSKSAGAVDYIVYRRKAGTATWTKLITTKNTVFYYVDTKAVKGATYFYTVKAVNGNYTSTYVTNKYIKKN